MKKSFKKAGAAVLSMSMLLAMGAVTMPVYADTVYSPGQAQVSIAVAQDNSDKQGYDTRHNYNYLSSVNSAHVTMFKVAELSNGGWQWDPTVRSALEADPDVNSSFTDLLTYVNSSGTVVDNDTAGAMPQMSSDDLQALASKLERIVSGLSGYPNVTTYIAEGDITKQSDGTFSTVNLPGTDKLFDPGKTKDVIGYYLIITDTNDAGVVIQPILIPLKNDKDGKNVKKVSLKGTNIDIQKTITDVGVKTTVTEGEGEEATTSPALYKGSDVISSTGKSAVVAKNDTIYYQIAAQLPKYDTNLKAVSNITATDTYTKNIKDFVITDTPDSGIVIPASNTDVSNSVLNSGIKVYFSTDSTLVRPGGIDVVPDGQTADILLKEGYDYVVQDSGDGFKIVITGLQLRGQTVSSSTDGNNITTYSIAENAVSALNLASTAVNTMENGNIFVQFEATITDDLKRSHTEIQESRIYGSLTQSEIGSAVLPAVLDSADETAYGTHLASLSMTAEEKTAIGKIVGDNNKELLDETSGAYKGKPNELYVKAYYALKAINEDIDTANDNAKIANGNKNIATMTYGNKFATGQGEGTDTDQTKVYSIDLELTKISVEHNIDDDTISPVYVKALVGTEDATKAKTVSGGGDTAYIYISSADNNQTTTVANDAKKNASDQPIYLESITETTVLAEAKKTTGDAPIYVSSADPNQTTLAEGSAKTKVTAWKDAENKEPVAGAVFELTQVYSAVEVTGTKQLKGAAGNYSLGKAVSDSNGKLKLLKAGTATTTEPVIGQNGVYYYETVVEGENTSYIPYVLETEGNLNAWTELTAGTYNLKELYAPSGYKKWAVAGYNFTVGATKTEGEFNGHFTGTSTNNPGFLGAEDNGTATFTCDATNGKLTHEIVNPFDDKLPATGGIGTVLFTAGGISVVLIAGALFVMYMKKKNSEDEE